MEVPIISDKYAKELSQNKGSSRKNYAKFIGRMLQDYEMKSIIITICMHIQFSFKSCIN